MIVVDSGVLFGATDRRDRHHQACAELLTTHPGPLLAPVPVVVEAAWMIESRLGPAAEADFLQGAASGEPRLVELEAGDWARAIELIRTYHDLGLGLVDASVVAVAERLGVTTLATLNHRDFTVVRPRHVDAFELLP